MLGRAHTQLYDARPMGMSAEFVAEIIDQSASALAEQTATIQIERFPGLRDQFGPAARERLSADTLARISYLAAAVAFDEPSIFASQVAWTRMAMHVRDVPPDHLRANLHTLRALLLERLPIHATDRAARMLDAAMETLDGPCEPAPSSVEGDGPLQRLTRAYLLALLEADRVGARDLLVGAARAGTSVPDLYEHVIFPAHRELGRMWQLGEISVAEEHYASAAAEWTLPQVAAIAEYLPETGRTLAATTADGDHHVLGLRLVTDFFEFAGWRTYFLGASTPAPDLVQAMFEQRVDLLAVSASLGVHLRTVRSLISAIRSVPEVASTPIIVGGAAFAIAPDLWRKVGADGSAPSASAAVRVGEALVNRRG